MKKLQKGQAESEQNRAYGFSRYVFGEKYILGSSSFEEAVKKSKKDQRLHQGGDAFYYNEGSLWQEFQFLFMIQYVEFETGELISHLTRNNIIKATSYIQELKNRTELDDERKGTDRALSPYALSVLLGFGLGKLIEIVRDHTDDFEDKNQIVEKLEKFNEYRKDFIHKSFSNSTDITKVLNKGIESGRRLLKYYEMAYTR